MGGVEVGDLQDVEIGWGHFIAALWMGDDIKSNVSGGESETRRPCEGLLLPGICGTLVAPSLEIGRFGVWRSLLVVCLLWSCFPFQFAPSHTWSLLLLWSWARPILEKVKRNETLKEQAREIPDHVLHVSRLLLFQNHLHVCVLRAL